MYLYNYLHNWIGNCCTSHLMTCSQETVTCSIQLLMEGEEWGQKREWEEEQGTLFVDIR